MPSFFYAEVDVTEQRDMHPQEIMDRYEREHPDVEVQGISYYKDGVALIILPKDVAQAHRIEIARQNWEYESEEAYMSYLAEAYAKHKRYIDRKATPGSKTTKAMKDRAFRARKGRV